MTPDLDIAFARVEALAVARNLPGMTRGTAWGTPALKVKNTAFVRIKAADTLVLACPEDQKALLMEMAPEIYFQTDHYVGHPALLVRLDAISDEELSLRLEDAWRHCAPQQIAAMRPTAPASTATD